MTQSTPPNESRRNPTPPKDLDTLLDTLQGDQRAAGGAQPQAEAPSDLTARRVQVLIRAFDALHRQVSAIATQGDTINTLAEGQAQNTKAVGDLQRNVRYLRALVIQQLQQSMPAPNANLPPLNIKLVVGHLVEQYQQAERDAAVLTQWAMLFVGVAVGSLIAALGGLIERVVLSSLIFGTIAAFSLAVALIFWGLGRSARGRAAIARRSMDESTLVRTVATNPTGETS